MKMKADDVFPVKKVRFELPVPLDEAMCEHRGMRAAQLQGTLEAVELEVKVAKEHVREKEKRVAALDAEIRVLQAQIRTGKGTAMVEAEERANFSTNEIETWVLEGPMYGVIASTRPMSGEERQLAIDVDAVDGDLPPREPARQVRVKRKPKKDEPPADAAPPTH